MAHPVAPSASGQIPSSQSALSQSAASQPAASQPASVPARPRVALLVFAGAKPDPLCEYAEQTLQKLARTAGTFDVESVELCKQPSDTRDLARIFNPERLSRFGAVVLCAGDDPPKLAIADAQKAALLEAVESGRLAVVAIRGAIDLCPDWPQYADMLGASSDGRPWPADGSIKTFNVIDRDHPATAAAGAIWFTQEAVYQFKDPYDAKKLHVLVRLDPRANDLRRPEIHRTDRDFAIAWSRVFGRGRVFYTSLGGSKDTWDDERYRQHLAGGIRWALGLAAGEPRSPDAATETFQTTERGVQYRDIVVGDGATPRPFATVTIHYTGWLIDGTKFDSSHDRGQPLRFTIGAGDMIEGFDEGLRGMHVGGQRKLIIPPELAYGLRGVPGVVPPDAKLVFEVELLKVGD